MDEHVVFASATGLSLLMLVNEAYNFEFEQDDQETFPWAERRFLRLCVVVRREFPELLEVFERHSQNQKPTKAIKPNPKPPA